MRRLYVQRWILELAAFLGVGALLSLSCRTDANWDLQNYHLYAPFAALNGRLGADYFAGGFQAYLNPLEDMPYYMAKFVLFPHAPRIVALCAGLPFGFLAFVVFQLARTLVGEPWAATFAALTGLTGATTLSEVGTTYDDILTAGLVLLALLGVVRFWRHAVAIAGGLCGLAVALKLTAAIYVLPLAGAVAIMAPARRDLFRNAGIFTATSALAFTVGYGWWGVLLWRHFHDPVFPLLGGLFHAPLALRLDPHDVRFLPRSVGQWIAYPLYWIEGRSFVVSEEPLRDPRFALAWLAALAAGVGLLRRRMERPEAPTLALWWFIVVAYPIWLMVFSILRYALPLEVCTGIFVVTVLQRRFARATVTRLALALLVFCLVTTKPIGWGRIGYGESLVEGKVPVLPSGALVLMRGAPLGYVVVRLATSGSRFVNMQDLALDPAEQRIVRRRLARSRPAFLLTNRPVTHAAPALARFGTSVGSGACRIVHSPVQRSIELCRIRRDPKQVESSHWKQRVRAGGIGNRGEMLNGRGDQRAL